MLHFNKLIRWLPLLSWSINTTTGFVGGGNFKGPPRHSSPLQSNQEAEFESFDTLLLAHVPCKEDDEYEWERHKLTMTATRGGSTATSDSVVKGTQLTLATSANFWKKSFDSYIGKPLGEMKIKVTSLFRSKEEREEAAIMEQLQTMPIRRVVVPNSTVLPDSVVQLAARRAGMLGQPLRTDRVQDFARTLSRWYNQKGFVLHSVTGATLKPDSATAEISVQEPRISSVPVGITFCKEMVVDPDTGELLTFRQYKDKHVARKTFGFDSISKESLNTTYVTTTGKTKPNKIASALGFIPGRPFQWDTNRWQNIARSRIFSTILRATPQPMRDGTVQLHIIATEAPARHLEYGVGKSLYTGGWEGELDFEHVNLLGGGETLGLSVRRGTKDVEPSVRLRFSDDKFGMGGGYDVEVFSDYVGEKGEQEQEEQIAVDYESDDLVDRKGVMFRLQNPIQSSRIRRSAMSASMERTTTKTRLHEGIGSATLSLGPFVKQLPYNARSNLDASLTGGTRILGSIMKSKEETSSLLLTGLNYKPYVSVSATSKQILPLRSSVAINSGKRPLILALRHSVTTSSSNLPRHEAKAQGTVNNIRGATPNGRIKSAIRGTTELRVPIELPMLKQVRQDASVVVFGDWLVATQDSKSPFLRKSSIGVGVRKSIQGIPLQYDVSVSNEGKLKAAFSLGRDFDV